MNLSEKIAAGMSKTRAGLGSRLAFLFRSRKSEKEFYEELEEILITSDVGVSTAQTIVGSFRALAARQTITGADALQAAFSSFLEELLARVKSPIIEGEGMTVLMLLGEWIRKTTTAGKLAKLYNQNGRNVLLAAADTFRAAAADQLAEWSQGGCASGPATGWCRSRRRRFDAMDAARARKHDVVIIDTAGRFHNRENLVRELQKIDKIVRSKIGSEDRYLRMIVLDATAGSNAYTQAKSFHEAVPLDGAILTKLDSSAKGGVVLPLLIDLELPVVRVGVGEGVDDLVP